MTDSDQPKSFEGALAALEEIVRKLESGDVPLEQSIAYFEEGDKLRRVCQERLDAARLKIEAIQTAGGQPSSRPFDPE